MRSIVEDPAKPPEGGVMKTIVVGYNESGASDRAIERAGEMARL